MTKKVAKVASASTAVRAPRRDSVPMENLIQAIKEGAEKQLTSTQVAEGLGMALGSFNQRLTALRSAAKEVGFALPKLKGARGPKKDLVLLAKSIFGAEVFAKLAGLDTVPVETTEATTEPIIEEIVS